MSSDGAAWRRIALAAAGGLGLIVASACRRGPEPPSLVRLGELVDTDTRTTVELPAIADLGAEPQVVPVDLAAAAVARLSLRAAGDAGRLTLGWKRDSEARFAGFRRVVVPLDGDGAEHSYEIPLESDNAWNGRVVALRLAVEGGTARLGRLAAEPAASALRSTSLRGVTVPALPGGTSWSVALPERLPARARFHARLGILPELQKRGVQVRFRITYEHAGRSDVWLDRIVRGKEVRRRGWVEVGREVDGAGGGRVVLRTDARLHSRALDGSAALWGNPLLRAVAPTPAGPNLVVILIDTLRADALGSYGNPDRLTPELDAFAGRAVRFARMLAPAPWTLPSVASLLTGLAPQTHGAGRVVGAGLGPTGLDPRFDTLAEILARRGFYTEGIFHNPFINPEFGIQQGFDLYVADERPPAAEVDHALDDLRRMGGRRFFLYLHLLDPHNPYQPSAESCRDVARRLVPGYRGALGCSADRSPLEPEPAAGDRAWIRALYDSEVADADRAVGSFLAGLERQGLDRDTVVLVTADHGEEFWSRPVQEAKRGYKINGDHGHTLYQELVEIPALLRVPGRRAAVVHGPTKNVDLLPTLLTALGIHEKPPTTGRDLTSYLDDGRPIPPRLALADDLLYGPPRESVRRGPWKLILAHDGGGIELYDLDTDPGERTDVSAAHPDVVAALRRMGAQEVARRERLRRQLLAGGGDARSLTHVGDKHLARLRALGYLK